MGRFICFPIDFYKQIRKARFTSHGVFIFNLVNVASANRNSNFNCIYSTGAFLSTYSYWLYHDKLDF